MFLDVLIDSVIDTLKIIPFLFVTYLIMEYLESKTEDHSQNFLSAAGKYGPLLGGLIGIIPQCGFSAAAASFYSGGVITLGTMTAVFLSTSDEMLPILISEAAGVERIIRIMAVKMILAVITGFAVDLITHIVRLSTGNKKHIHDLCEREHCGCDEEEGGGIFMPALKHTLHITFFIFVLSLIIGLLVEGVGEQNVSAFLEDQTIIGIVLAALIGLIPNCAASVMITEFYINGILGSGQMMAGLMVSAGVGLLVLFRTNRNMKENIIAAAVLFASGIFWGSVITFTGITF